MAMLGVNPKIRVTTWLSPESISKKHPVLDWPHTIVFDWNGTIDARGTGRGIPITDLQKLQNAGKNVSIFTSSVMGDDKLFMRQVCTQHGIPFTDDEKILDHADVFVGDKNSDRRRAGQHGVKWIHVKDFNMKKLIDSYKPDSAPEVKGGHDRDSHENHKA
jgi:hypothetical protein